MCNIWTTFFKGLLGLTKQAKRFSGVGTVGRSVFAWSLCPRKTLICWMQASQDGSSSETGRNMLAKHRLLGSLISSRWEEISKLVNFNLKADVCNTCWGILYFFLLHFIKMSSYFCTTSQIWCHLYGLSMMEKWNKTLYFPFLSTSTKWMWMELWQRTAFLT